MYAAVKAAAKALKREVLALYYAIQDERTPLLAKVLPWLVGRTKTHACSPGWTVVSLLLRHPHVHAAGIG